MRSWGDGTAHLKHGAETPETRPSALYAGNCQIHRESSALSLKGGNYSVVVVWVEGRRRVIGIRKLHRFVCHFTFLYSHTRKSPCWSKDFFLVIIIVVFTQSKLLGHSIAFSSSVWLASGSTQLKFSQQLRCAYHGWLLFLESLVLNGDMTQSNSQSVR